MAKVRVNKKLKEEMKEFIESSDRWEQQSEFANQAIRNLLNKEKGIVSEKEKKAIKEIVKEELDESV